MPHMVDNVMANMVVDGWMVTSEEYEQHLDSDPIEDDARTR